MRLLCLFVADRITPFRINPPVIRLFIHGFFILTILVTTGCGKSSTPPATAPQPSTINSDESRAGHQPSTTTAPSFRLHWLGKKRLAAESNATNFISIWNMPESLRLESQTLDKLSTAPWRLLTTATPLSNAPTALLRPLLDDLVQEESYLEISATTNHPAEIVLAIKLPPERAALWRSNLPIILKSVFADVVESKTLTADTFSANFRLQTSDFRLNVTRAGDWTLLSIHPSKNPSINNQLSTINIASRLSTTGLPFAPETTNFWISGRADLSALSHIVGWSIRSNINLPVCEFSAIGDGTNVRSLAKLIFPSKAPIELEPWNIPTNLVHDPLTGFMSVRGIRPFLKMCGLWDESKFGDTPNQATFWSQSGHPALRFFALPSQQSSNQMALFTRFLLEDVNPIMAVFPNTTSVPIGSFEPILGSPRLRWRGIPYIMPNLDVTTDSNAFIVGGFFQNRITNSPPPDSLMTQFKTDSNIILYDWEASQATTYALIQVSQATRFVFGLNRLSMTNNPALPWIVAISHKLGTSGTTIRLSSPTSVSFTRSSTIGLTGLEIHLLAEWLESPSFPKGMFSVESNQTNKAN